MKEWHRPMSHVISLPQASCQVPLDSILCTVPSILRCFHCQWPRSLRLDSSACHHPIPPVSAYGCIAIPSMSRPVAIYIHSTYLAILPQNVGGFWSTTQDISSLLQHRALYRSAQHITRFLHLKGSTVVARRGRKHGDAIKLSGWRHCRQRGMHKSTSRSPYTSSLPIQSLGRS